MNNVWQRKKVGEIAKHSLGKMLDKAKNKGEPKPYLRNLNVRWFDFDLSDVLEMRFLPEEKDRYTVIKGDVVICEGGYPGRAAIWERDEPIYFQKALHRVRFNEPERSKWFLYYLLSKDFDGTLKNHFNGTGIQHFTGEALAQFEIPLPPLFEQQRIVRILDEAFAAITTARVNTEKNLQNTRALFESYLQSVFKERGTGWEDTKLDLVCGFQNGFAFKSSTFKPSGAPILRISNIQDGRVDTDGLVFFQPSDYRENLDRYRIVEDDLLIAMSGATTGKLGFNTEKTIFYLNQRVGKFEPSEKLNKRFLYYFMCTKVKENLRISAGAAQPNLSTEQIKNFMLPLPDAAEQSRIVNVLDSLLEETKRLETLYYRKLVAFASLKKSLLHQAFSGEL